MSNQSTEMSNPRVFVLKPSFLNTTKNRIGKREAAIQGAWEKLAAEANDALSAGPFSVMDKPVAPPSGDKHDYMSMAPYWWPNPETPDGLPYIRRDGEVNPERDKLDRTSIVKFSYHVDTLALAYYLSGEEKYAAHAARLLKAWFIDEETKMNPHLTYGQSIRGICDGRGIGIIETRNFLRAINAVGLLQQSPSWTGSDQAKLESWFKNYLDWLLNSQHGRDEGSQANNHGTHYDVQVAFFSLFVREDDIAKQILTDSAPNRIAKIEPDGRQPLELARTKALGYSTMNLDAMMDLAAMGETFGIDLWHYQTKDGRGIRTALDFLVPFYTQPEKWPYPQIQPLEWDLAMNVLRRGAWAYTKPEYEQTITKLSEMDTANARVNLLYPSYEG
jgi:hypothetical protein